jgi:hypothetical protein
LNIEEGGVVEFKEIVETEDPKSEIKVVEWIAYEDADETLHPSVGSWGGFFKNGMRWKDYYEDLDEEISPYVLAIFKEVKDTNKKIGGYDHQNSGDGVPLFSDGKCGLWSRRGWSDLMAAIWSEIENKDYSYIDFYTM